MNENPDRSLSRSTSGVLNRLIVACHDGIDAQRAAALVVRGSDRREHLEDVARRRASFVHELSEIVRASGRTASVGGSAVETARAGLARMRTLVVGTNAGDSYASCARIEAKTESLYRHAVAQELPDAVREVVARHYAEIAAAHAELRRLTAGG